MSCYMSQHSKLRRPNVYSSVKNVPATDPTTLTDMLSYDDVIRKRLRLKNKPPIAPYEQESPADIARTNSQIIIEKITPVAVAKRNSDEADGQRDTRTEAQKQHDAMMRQREKDLLRKEAAKSYKEHVEVRCLFVFL